MRYGDCAGAERRLLAVLRGCGRRPAVAATTPSSVRHCICR